MRFTRKFSLFCVVVLAAAMISPLAEAQPGGGRGGRGGAGGGRPQGGMFGGRTQGGGFGRTGTATLGRSQLLRSEDVQKELKVTDAQMDTIKEAMEAFRADLAGSRPTRESMEEMREKMQSMSDEERREYMTKLAADARAKAEKATKETDAVLEALLDPSQIERLDQIVFQQKLKQGMAGLLQDEAMQKKLELSEEQVAKIKAIEEQGQEQREKARDEMRAAFQRPRDEEGGERPDFRAIMEEMREKSEKDKEELEKKTVAVLTSGQKAKIETMKGAAFELDMRSLMGGRGRGGNDRGRGRGGRGEDGGRGGREGGGRGGRGGRPAADDPTIF